MCLSKIRARYILAAVVCFTLFAACKPDEVKVSSAPMYFDVLGAIHKDSTRLTSLNPVVEKTVEQNGVKESKRLKIANWGHELSLFASSDINKPSWRGSYAVSKQGDTITYTAKTPELKTRMLRVVQRQNKLTYLEAKNRTKNMLFEATDELQYTPDSAYRIDKTQRILLLGINRYIITGKFLK